MSQIVDSRVTLCVVAKIRRLRIDAVVSREASNGWRRFAVTHGTTVAALVEAMGRTWNTDAADIPESEWSEAMRMTISLARQIAAERRSRSSDDEEPSEPAE